MPEERNLLPKDVKPRHYHLHVEFDDALESFEGRLTVDVSIAGAVSIMTVNAADMVIHRVVVKSATGHEISVAPDALQWDAHQQRVSVPLDGAPLIGDATVTFDYTGKVTTDMLACYRSSYTYEGKKRTVIATQLCPIEGRRVLPCWDEPGVKATFALELVVPRELTALSNMPPSSCEDVDDTNKTLWVFPATPLISIYLVAFVVGEFDSIESRVPKSTGQGSDTSVRVYTPLGAAPHGQFALDVACRVMPLYERLFGIDYVLPKLDLVALPEFLFGAMENWGVVTFRDQALLCGDKASADSLKQVGYTVAHEIAHQWFGNLVTMEWWKELWLNESFATYIASIAIKELFPEWHAEVQFVFDESAPAFELDALRNSHPIEVELRDAREVDGIFDNISYSKGGCVLRMTVEYIGVETFEKGVRAYLDAHRFGNASTEDLWKALGEAHGADLASILSHWTHEQGYPLVDVKCVDAATGKKLVMEQHRFLMSRDVTAAEDAVIWQIPLLITTAADGSAPVTQRTLVRERVSDAPLPSHAIDWVKVNTNQAAFCRVRYTPDMLRQLCHAVEAKAIGCIDRFSLLNDYSSFARGGHCATEEALELLVHYKGEDDYTVWCAVTLFERCLRIVVTTQGADALQDFDVFCQNLYGQAMRTLGYAHRPSDDFRTQQLRSLLFGRMLACRDPQSLQAADDKYAARATQPVPKDMIGFIFGVQVAKSDVICAEVMEQVAGTTDSETRTQLLSALTWAAGETAVQQLFDFALTKAVKAQDTSTLLARLARRPATSAAFAHELVLRWDTLTKKIPNIAQGRVLKELSNCSDAALVPMLKTFFNGLPAKDQASLGRSFQQGLEGLTGYAAWAACDAQNILRFIRK